MSDEKDIIISDLRNQVEQLTKLMDELQVTADKRLEKVQRQYNFSKKNILLKGAAGNAKRYTNNIGHNAYIQYAEGNDYRIDTEYTKPNLLGF